MVLKHRQFCPSGDIPPGLEIFSIVMTREVGRAIDTQWVEAREVAEHPTKHRKASRSQELSCSQCEQCRGCKTLVYVKKS